MTWADEAWRKAAHDYHLSAKPDKVGRHRSRLSCRATLRLCRTFRAAVHGAKGARPAPMTVPRSRKDDSRARISSSALPEYNCKLFSCRAPRLFKTSKVDTRSERVIGPVTSSIRLAQVLGTAASLVDAADTRRE